MRCVAGKRDPRLSTLIWLSRALDTTPSERVEGMGARLTVAVSELVL
jgi:hypothetical protein